MRDSGTLPDMATDSNYDAALGCADSVPIIRDYLDRLHLDRESRAAEIAKASKTISDALALGQIRALLAVADSVDRLELALAERFGTPSRLS